MSTKRLTLKEERMIAYNQGQTAGYLHGKKEEANSKSAEKQRIATELIRVTAELAQANAKLTYSISQIVSKLP